MKFGNVEVEVTKNMNGSSLIKLSNENEQLNILMPDSIDIRKSLIEFDRTEYNQYRNRVHQYFDNLGAPDPSAGDAQTYLEVLEYKIAWCEEKNISELKRFALTEQPPDMQTEWGEG